MPPRELKPSSALNIGRHVVTRRQFIVGAFSGEQRPRPALAPAQERTAIVALSVAIVVVASPAGPDWSFHLQHVIDHLHRIDDERIVGTAHAVADQFQEAAIDHVTRFEINSVRPGPGC